jgi:hypothetical protein
MISPYYDLNTLEMDAAVARACGEPFKAIWKGGDRSKPGAVVERSGGARFDWHPSTDLNDAFAAAEKVGLFKGDDEHGRASLQAWRVGWVVVDEEMTYQKTLSERVVGCGATPALAICAAILKLKA